MHNLRPRPLILAAIAILFAVLASAVPGFAASPDNFLGRWDLTLKSADHQYPSWLEITRDNGEYHARMTGRWGHARALPKVEVSGDHITFVSPREEEDAKADLTFEGKLSGKTLSGTLNGPDGTTWQWTGQPAPSLKRAHAPKWGKPRQLFNGKDLTGWTPSDPNAAAKWTVEDGALVSPGHGPELISNAKFQDFKLHIEFNCQKDSNSGIYLRGRYEVQVENDPQPEGPNMRTGAVYGFLVPSPEPPRRPGEWQTYDITFVGRTVTVVLNGQTIIDQQEIPGLTGGALDSHEGQPGPIYLQGSENGHVSYRNITLTPAK